MFELEKTCSYTLTKMYIGLTKGRCFTTRYQHDATCPLWRYVIVNELLMVKVS
ncbi:hypothetical protein HanRHA438_Chr11g0518831 [Helianthus annuus]|uniref:Uncharacterized protein n=1 Tax=Helianthus annuus TaxID=4232 RepID=A0A251TEU2_HELAN|nr:hypothetical protein HanXRQr2_Chr11g0506371 [Helianthus annuus]KAJ0872003.1 hypothetical protein HanRHA438_Chr11g0518831 [Helianthus annuus]KAJ0876397.1 hypothetical protein HanPSC8_Chr11g0487941 [Helianthus annuus]